MERLMGEKVEVGCTDTPFVLRLQGENAGGFLRGSCFEDKKGKCFSLWLFQRVRPK